MSTENQHAHFRKFKFFRILLNGFMTKLAIPQRLTSHFIKENLTSATLLRSLGKSWNVRIHGDSKGLYFTEGWEEFAAAHRLSFGELLVFKYKGGKVFDVTIFDKSTCEKEYYRVTNGTSCADDDRIPGEDDHQDNSTENESSSGGHLMEQTGGGGAAERNRSPAPASSNPSAVHEFRSTMTSSNVHKGGYVTIPSGFTLDLTAEREAFLVDARSRVWPARICYCQRRSWCRISHGWLPFCRENGVGVGDVCVFSFEYRGSEATFHVQVIKRRPKAAGRRYIV